MLEGRAFLPLHNVHDSCHARSKSSNTLTCLAIRITAYAIDQVDAKGKGLSPLHNTDELRHARGVHECHIAKINTCLTILPS